MLDLMLLLLVHLALSCRVQDLDDGVQIEQFEKTCSVSVSCMSGSASLSIAVFCLLQCLTSLAMGLPLGVSPPEEA